MCRQVCLYYFKKRAFSYSYIYLTRSKENKTFSIVGDVRVQWRFTFDRIGAQRARRNDGGRGSRATAWTQWWLQSHNAATTTSRGWHTHAHTLPGSRYILYTTDRGYTNTHTNAHTRTLMIVVTLGVWIYHIIYRSCRCGHIRMESIYPRRVPIMGNLSGNGWTVASQESVLSLIVVLGSSVSLVGLIFAFITYR